MNRLLAIIYGKATNILERFNIMIWDANIKIDFTEEELKFFGLIAQHAEDNKIADISEEDLKEEMEQKGIEVAKFDALIKRMEDFQILKHHPVGGQEWVSINSLQVEAVKCHLKEHACPDCGEPGLEEITKLRCRFCKHEFPKNK